MNHLNRISNDTVLVTGASGFIGSHLCRSLLAAGAEVHGVCRTVPADGVAGVRWWPFDMGDSTAVLKVVADLKPQLVFHLASHVSGDRRLEAVLPTLQSNLVSTVNLLTAVTQIGCRRIVLAGSLEEPDANEGSAIPASPYAAAKFASSAYTGMFRELYGTPAVVARIFMVYGPGQRDLRKLVPHVILSLLRNEGPALSSGTRPVDWIYVEDVVEGLLAAATAPDAIGQTVDLGSGAFTSVRDIALQLSKIIGSPAQPEFGKVPERPMERVRLADVAKARRVLNWKPSVSIDEGLRRTVAWYSEALRSGVLESTVI